MEEMGRIQLVIPKSKRNKALLVCVLWGEGVEFFAYLAPLGMKTGTTFHVSGNACPPLSPKSGTGVMSSMRQTWLFHDDQMLEKAQ